MTGKIARVLALIVLLALVVWIALLPGRVRLDAAGTQIDMATPMAVFAGILAVAVLAVALRLIWALFRLPRTLRTGRAAKRREAGDAVVRAMAAVAAENEASALDHAERARKLLGDSPQALHASAAAYSLAGRDADAAAAHARLAEFPDSAPIGLRGLLERAIAAGDWPEARRLIARAEAAKIKGTWFTKTANQVTSQN